jgi:hypothetical protein
VDSSKWGLCEEWKALLFGCGNEMPLLPMGIPLHYTANNAVELASFEQGNSYYRKPLYFL